MWTNTIMLKIVKIEEGSCLSQFFFYTFAQSETIKLLCNDIW